MNFVKWGVFYTAICKNCHSKSLFLKLNEDGLCINCQLETQATVIKEQIEELQKQLKDEQVLYSKIKNNAEKDAIASAEKTANDITGRAKKVSREIDETIKQQNIELTRIEKVITEKRNLIIELDDEILYQDFSLYKPQYDFLHSDQYKAKLDDIRKQQKALIKTDGAVRGSLNWTVNGKTSDGKRMIKNMQKLLLRAFNSECDLLVDKVKYQNYDSYLSRIRKSCDAISKLGTIMQISISPPYLYLKEQELTLAYEYRMKKQVEKEEQKELRAQMREEAKLKKEIEEARNKTKKEERHYQNELNKLKKQLETASDDKKADIQEKISFVEAQLLEIEKALKDIDYREANHRAGYVYIISNIGSFGEGVYKIGMTRRLDPYERIYELSDASVPFNFDVHAMLFSEDTPKLEASLHQAFDKYKVNMINTRREFFRVPLEQIKEEIQKNYDKIAEFTDIPEAEQYRLSKKMREQIM